MLCSPLLFDVPALTAKYRFLRKMPPDSVTFHLIYHPYWSSELHGLAQGRFFSKTLSKPLIQNRVCDAYTARHYLVHSEPVTEENALDAAELVPALLRQEDAATAFENLCQRDWTRKHCRVWQPHVDIQLVNHRIFLIYKPFWVMVPAPMPEPHNQDERVFVFDATTGLGGMAEFRPVLDYWWQKQNCVPLQKQLKFDLETQISA